jgi:hypothetical protein
VKPKSNQQIATNTNHFPTYLKCDQIICSDQQQHRTSKKTQVTQKTGLMCISLHISQTIDMNTKTYKSDCNHHRSTQCIKAQKPINSYSMCTKPRGQRNNNRRSQHKNFIKNKKTKKGSSSLALNSYTSTTTRTKPSAHLAS